MVILQYFSTQDHAAAAIAKAGIPVLHGKVKQRKNIGGVLNKLLKVKKIGNQI